MLKADQCGPLTSGDQRASEPGGEIAEPEEEGGSVAEADVVVAAAAAGLVSAAEDGVEGMAAGRG